MINYQELPYRIRKIWRSPHVAVGVELFVSDQMEDHVSLAEVAVLRQVEIPRAQPFTLLSRLHGCKNKKLEEKNRDILRLPTTPFSLVLRKEYFDSPQRDSHAVQYIY
jgi:hypothetical protein